MSRWPVTVTGFFVFTIKELWWLIEKCLLSVLLFECFNQLFNRFWHLWQVSRCKSMHTELLCDIRVHCMTPFMSQRASTTLFSHVDDIFVQFIMRHSVTASTCSESNCQSTSKTNIFWRNTYSLIQVFKSVISHIYRANTVFWSSIIAKFSSTQSISCHQYSAIRKLEEVIAAAGSLNNWKMRRQKCFFLCIFFFR